MQLSDRNTMLKEAKTALSMLETQIAQSKEMASQGLEGRSEEFELGVATSENAQKLEAAQAQYDNLLLRYTQKHPDVRKLKKTIEKLESAIAEENKAAEEQAALAEDQKALDGLEEGAADAVQDDEQPGLGGMPNFPAMQQEAQLKQLRGEIQELQSDIAKIQESMKIYQQRVEDTPKRELELQSLKRDYSNIQNVFNSLLDRKLEAELSVSMEKKQKGEQFRILDHARLPEKPITPNVKLLFLLSVAGGLGFGGGIIFLREVMNLNVIRSDSQIEETLKLNILASIPPIKTSADRARQRIKTILFAGCCCYATIFLLFFAILNQKGLDRTLNFIKMYITV
jgi:uncharacterized protein involved in exopolysaccharide biosynthesis